MAVAGDADVKSGDSGLLRKPLSATTIYEKAFLGNRISLGRRAIQAFEG
jgi:hypothetical protein